MHTCIPRASTPPPPPSLCRGNSGKLISLTVFFLIIVMISAKVRYYFQIPTAYYNQTAQNTLSSSHTVICLSVWAIPMCITSAALKQEMVGGGLGGVGLGGNGGIGGGGDGGGEGGYVPFHWLPIHQVSVHCCAGRQAAQKRTRPGNRAPPPQPSLIPRQALNSAWPFPEPAHQLPPLST